MILKRVIIFVFISLSLSISELISQPGNPGDDPDGDPVPIGGIEILLAVGGALGAKKLISAKKNINKK